MKNQQQKIEAALTALNSYVEASKQDALEDVQDHALSAIRDAGYDWEADEQLMHYCLKATDEECAEATLLHFKRWVEEQQPVLGDDPVARAQQLAADVAAQDGLNEGGQVMSAKSVDGNRITIPDLPAWPRPSATWQQLQKVYDGLCKLMAMDACGRSPFACADMVGQDELFEIQDALARLTLSVANFTGQAEGLVKQFPYIYGAEGNE
tara:strand:+ start:2308 stop:2934 length:627 start_codon:yes stop_codon:yes gene_type:complete